MDMIDTISRGHPVPGKQRPLLLHIRRACYTFGFLGALSNPMVNAANPIDRPSSHAFSIPNEIVHRIKAGPVITTQDGLDYLQFITSTDTADTYQSIIAGPIDKLLDKTIPWNDIVYSNHTFRLVSQTYPLGTLVDLNNDGISTLIAGLSEYDINQSLTLISYDVFDGAVTLNGLQSDPVFIDFDDDDDLDMFITDFKYGNRDYYENVGTPEGHSFIYRGENINAYLDQYAETLPPSFFDYFNSQSFFQFPYPFGYPLIFDFDEDGDLDLLMFDDDAGSLSYFEQDRSAGKTKYSEPFSTKPTGFFKASWVTDFDTDGDMDLLVITSSDEFLFFERIRNKPVQYSDPVEITNFPQWSGSFFGAPNSASISRSKEIFNDIDNDGFQEMLVVQTTDYESFKLILLKKRADNSFEQRLIYQGNEIYNHPTYSLQFIDGTGDGKADIALQIISDDNTESHPILLFEQLGASQFSAPQSLSPTALGLNQSWSEELAVDFDQDGDMDTVYNHSVTWNLDSNPSSITNFSTRSHVGEGPNILIGGFIIEGDSPQTVILRGLGPSLTDKGVRAPLGDPVLYLFSGSTLIAHNDDWQSTEGANKIETAGVGLEHPNEAALRVRLNPGAYTAHLKGSPGDTGIGIIAIDSDNQMPTNSLQVNISSRAQVAEGENIAIGGFIIEGDTPVKVLIRGLGPHLQEHGLDNPLADPDITLFSGQSIIASNNDWMSSKNASEIAALEIAPTHESEAAILTELEPGAYTVHLRGRSGETGVGIIAVDRL
ncbi:MAG: FG-GAP-like repeat-containing protein [Candidatus Thiodiazotropha sp.]